MLGEGFEFVFDEVAGAGAGGVHLGGVELLEGVGGVADRLAHGVFGFAEGHIGFDGEGDGGGVDAPLEGFVVGPDRDQAGAVAAGSADEQALARFGCGGGEFGADGDAANIAGDGEHQAQLGGGTGEGFPNEFE